MQVADKQGAAWGRKRRQQCAALPIAQRSNGPLILMVTSRGTRRWVIPKGWAEPHLPLHAQAEREAFEEAGILGAAHAVPIGAYRYRKRLANGRRVTCEVAVFPLQVAGFAAAWPEQGQREARWFTPEEAAASVDEPELAALLRGIAAGFTGREAA